MSVAGLTHLNAGLDSQPIQNSPTSSTSLHPLTPGITSQNAAAALPQDTFTPASQTESVASSAQAAGLFSGPKNSALSSSSTAVGSQGVTNNTAEIAAPSNAPANSQAGNNNSSASGGFDAGGRTASTSPDAGATSAASTSAGSDSASSSSAVGSVAQQTQLDSLNNALAALGLSAADIQQIDQVASLTHDYSPTAFTNLAYQLEAQAQNAAASGASASAQNTQPSATSSSAPSASSSLKAATSVTPQGSAPSPQAGSNGPSLSLRGASTQQSEQTESPAASAGALAASKSSAASA